MRAASRCPHPSPTDRLAAAAAGVGLMPAFQPVVSLDSGAIVGFEALSRWAGIDDMGPADVFAYADAVGRLDQLDDMCIRAAARTARDSAATPGMLLLINCEPTTGTAFAADPVVREAAEKFHMVLEVTERRLLDSPRTLLHKISDLRGHGFPIALDDVGAGPDSLALLDIVSPDIVKLDLRLVQREHACEYRAAAAAVRAYQARTGAVIVAEGIETDEHLHTALDFGATLGQGFRFGAAGDLTPSAQPWPDSAVRQQPEPIDDVAALFDAAACGTRTRVVDANTVNEIASFVERLATNTASPPIMLAVAGNRRQFCEPVRQRYARIAQNSPLLAVFGTELCDDPVPGVRGMQLDLDDPLSTESAVLILGPDIAAGLFARRHDGAAPTAPTHDGSPLFDILCTFDRSRVTRAARALLTRVS